MTYYGSKLFSVLADQLGMPIDQVRCLGSSVASLPISTLIFHGKLCYFTMHWNFGRPHFAIIDQALRKKYICTSFFRLLDWHIGGVHHISTAIYQSLGFWPEKESCQM
jgi:hypothetical protein